MPKTRGNGRTSLQLRGNGVGKRLAARIAGWNTSKMSDHSAAYHKPGSNKK